ncbi:MAG TPA: hypothetical protein VNO18_15655 [Xanthobacteraceae bacterium]|nr:hypothetical protein [Xanthobacteraceae bacterium]
MPVSESQNRRGFGNRKRFLNAKDASRLSSEAAAVFSMHIPLLCLGSPLIIGTPFPRSPRIIHFGSLFFHQSAPQLNIEKSYLSPMSSKDEPHRRLAGVESFLKQDFTLFFDIY